jgi:WD40 repeat protein
MGNLNVRCTEPSFIVDKALNSAVGTATASCTVCNGCLSERKKKPSRVLDTLEARKSQEIISTLGVVATTTLLSSRGAAVLAAFEDGTLSAWICQMSIPFSYATFPNREGEISSFSMDERSFTDYCQGGCDPVIFGVGSREGKVSIWELDTMCGTIVPKQNWRAHDQSPGFGQTFAGVSDLALDGNIVVTGGADGTVAMWGKNWDSTSRSRELLRRVDGAHGGATTVVCHATVGKASDFTMTAGEDGLIKVWSPTADCTLPRHEKDKGSASQNVRYMGSATGGARSLALDDKNFRCCAGFEDGFVRLWDLAANRGTVRLAHPPQALPEVSSGRDNRTIQAVAFDTSERNVSNFVSGSIDGSLCVWDVRASTSMRPQMRFRSFERDVTSLSVHGEVILAASRTGSAFIWDLRGSKFKPLCCMDLTDGSRIEGWYGSFDDRTSGAGEIHHEVDYLASDTISAPARLQASVGHKEKPPAKVIARQPSGDDAAEDFHHIAALNAKVKANQEPCQDFKL